MTDVVVRITVGEGGYPIQLRGHLNTFQMAALEDFAAGDFPGLDITYLAYWPLPPSLDADDLLLFGDKIAQDAIIGQLGRLGFDRPEDVMRYRTDGAYLVAEYACVAGGKKHQQWKCPIGRHQPPRADKLCIFEVTRVRVP